jgi:Zn-dependent M28 family amino/carboxypeptidase
LITRVLHLIARRVIARYLGIVIPSRIVGRILLLQAALAAALTLLSAQDIHSPFFNSSIQNIISQVSDSSLSDYVRSLQNFGTRSWTNANRDSIARWIRSKFYEAGVASVALDSFQLSGTLQFNVIATIPGAAQPPKEMIFGAHSDATTSNAAVSPGADDNASGVAAILEIARVLRSTGYQPVHTMRFIAFAGEEAGLKGSADYAAKAQLRGDPIKAMFNFDMVGYLPPWSTVRRFNVVKYASGVSLASLDSLMAVTYTSLVPNVTTASATKSDSYSFAQRGYAAVFLFDGGTSVAYHTAFDIIDSLNMGYAAEIVRTGLASALAVDSQLAAQAEAPVGPFPSKFVLHQNYPNPFNPSTTVSFSVARRTSLTLRVYDVMGRQVAILAEGTYGPGTYSVRWDAAGASAGLYFCQMLVDEGSFTRRMVLVR